MKISGEQVANLEKQFGRFVHMSPQDKYIWAKALLDGWIKYAPFSYDVRVGDGVPVPESASRLEKLLAYQLGAKRIDVVAKPNGETWLIEVKPRAGLSAIGQLIGYRVLYAAEHPDETTIRTWLVTDQLQNDMIKPLEAAEIEVYEVGL